MSDLIRRADAIEAVHKYFVKEIDKTPHEIDEDGDDVYTDMPTVNSLFACNKELSKALKALPSAEQVKGKLKNPCDSLLTDDSDECKEHQSKLESAEAVQGWIPCSERLPNDLEAVNVTWVNHNPPVYYQFTKDVPNVDTAVYHRGAWYWWDATVIDLLGEYDGAYVHGIEPIDKYIEITAWMPLPKPYKGGDSE